MRPEGRVSALSKVNNGALFVIVAGVLYGTMISGARWLTNLGFSALEIIVFSIALSLIPLTPAVLLAGKRFYNRSTVKFYLTYGGFTLAAFLTGLTGLALGLSVALVTLLLYTQPIWSTIFGKAFLNESFTRRKALANVAAIAGVTVIAEPWKSLGGNTLALFIAALSGVFFSLWVIMGRKSSFLGQNPVVTAFNTRLFTLALSIVFLPFAVLLIPDPTIATFNLEKLPSHFVLVLVYSLISGSLPDVLFYKGMATVSASIGGIMLLLEAVSAIAIAAIFLNQPVTAVVWVGGTLILLSNFLLTPQTNKKGQSYQN